MTRRLKRSGRPSGRQPKKTRNEPRVRQPDQTKVPAEDRKRAEKPPQKPYGFFGETLDY